MDEEALGERFETQARRQGGIYFTPAWLVQRVLDAVAPHAAARGKLAVVDPACGAGAFLSAAAEAQLQFQMRLRLSRHGLVPPHKITIRRKMFANQSEEMFANLLDFYRIAWEYEPRSFPDAPLAG